MACSIYWQAKEISRAIQHSDPDAAGVDLTLLSRISPIRGTMSFSIDNTFLTLLLFAPSVHFRMT
jgi:hypothetical protein